MPLLYRIIREQESDKDILDLKGRIKNGRATKTERRGGRWYASSATERKEHVESISLVKGGQSSFYAENILISSPTIFSSILTPKLVSCRASPRLKTLSASGEFRQDLYNHGKMPHLGQSQNVVIYINTIHDWEDVSSIFPIPRFSLPDLILHARHIRALFELLHA